MYGPLGPATSWPGAGVGVGGGCAGAAGAGAALAGAPPLAADGGAEIGVGAADDSGAAVLGGGAAGALDDVGEGPDDEADGEVVSEPKLPVPHAASASAIANPIPATAGIRGPWMFPVVARRLSFVGDPDGSPDVQQRYLGFTDALSASGTSAAGPIVKVGFRERSGADVAAQVVSLATRPDALVCANDELALSTMKALQHSGIRVPDDIAIVGWDDVMTARYVTPGLTTVRQPLYELGRAAATRLHERIAGAPTAPEPLILPTELVLRTSCGCPEKDRHDEPWVTT